MKAHPTSPQPVLPPCQGWALHDSAATRKLEAQALGRTPPHTLMAWAGMATARLAAAIAPEARRVVALCGPGNNGGDGLVAARHLHTRGFEVHAVLLADSARLPADAAEALAQAKAAGLQITSDLPAAARPPLIIDALLGLGARRAPEGAIASAIAWANARGVDGGCVLAVDLPSGLHPDTGALLGPDAVRATHTLSLLTLKPGLFTAQGRDHAGRVWLDTLGVLADSSQATARLAGPADDWPRARDHGSHKGRFGDVIVVGGAPGMSGAARLAARAALAAGAGRCYASLLDPDAAMADAAWPELMHLGQAWQAEPSRLAASTVVCGCGGGSGLRSVLSPLIAHAGRLLLDADALNAVAAEPALSVALKARTARRRPTVLTPHPLEAARLLETDTRSIQADRLGAASEIVRRYGAVVVLKGSGTVIAAPGEVSVINPTGNGLLASAGTGDVLAGWLGGLLAQGSGNAADVLRAAVAGVWAHGLAADHAAKQGVAVLRASTLIEAMTRRTLDGSPG